MIISTQLPLWSELAKHQPLALLFDMDGTLFNTEGLHAKALQAVGMHYKLRPPFPPHELEERFKGMSDHQVVEIAKSWLGSPKDLNAQEVIELKNQMLLQYIPQTEVSTFHRLDTNLLLKQARQANCLLAVVTSSERVVTDALLKHAGITSYFDLVITRQDVIRTKPDPYPYLLACEKLQLAPADCLGFEDSETGMQSAISAGLKQVFQAKWWN